MHANGAISKNHPLDVYFLETIRKHREEKKRVEREGREAIKRAHSKAIARIIQVPSPPLSASAGVHVFLVVSQAACLMALGHSA